MSREFKLEFSLQTPDQLDHKIIKYFYQKILELLNVIDCNSNYKLSLVSAEEIRNENL